jgi:DNA-binding NarL/FixJ family response regulator
MPITILIADDDPVIRDGLQLILSQSPDFKVKAQAADGADAVRKCEAYQIDVALLDIRMPILNGVDAVKQIRDRTGTKPIILSTFDDEELVQSALANGAKGYLLKGQSAEQIQHAIRVVAEGGTVFQDSIFETYKSGQLRKPLPDRFQVTDRELEIMEKIAKGFTNKEIADALYLSEGTVKNYISVILDKLSLRHRTEIAIYFIKGAIE